MFLDFEKLPLVVMIDYHEIWVILRHVYGLFAGETSVILLSIFLSPILSTNDILSIFESTWSFLHPRFTNHGFNCSRWLLRFSSVEQILLNLSVCNRSFIHITVTWLCMKVPVRIIWSFGLQYKSVSNLLPILVTMTPKKLIFVVK